MTQTPDSPGLDDKAHADHAWRRFRQILLAMAAGGVAISLLVVALIVWLHGPLPWLFIGFIVFGVWSTFMMAAALMGLMFLSSGTGHDDHVDDRISDDVLEEHER